MKETIRNLRSLLSTSEATVAELRAKVSELAHLLGDVQEALQEGDGVVAWPVAEMKAWVKAVGEAMEIKS